MFNGEEFLQQCISSVFCQTIKEVEVICIDDGSTDSSSQILETMAGQNPKIRVFHQENQGAGSARNLGIKKAKGKYVTFLDADDYYLDCDALEKMFRACEENNILLCASRKMCERRDTKERIIELYPYDIEGMILHYVNYQMDFFYQNYLFLRQMLVENNIFFPHYRRFQDPPFFVKASFSADEFMVADCCLYGYRTSDVNERFDTIEKVCDLIKGIIDNLIFARQNNLDILFENTVKHLEYDVLYILYRTITVDDLSILKLLMRANEIVNTQHRERPYIIRPLRMILFVYERYENTILMKIERSDELALYGAGRLTKVFLHYLKQKKFFKKVSAIVVSDMSGNEAAIDGIQVMPLDVFSKKKESIFLFVTVMKKYADEIEDSLLKINYKNYEVIDDIFGQLLLWKEEGLI